MFATGEEFGVDVQYEARHLVALSQLIPVDQLQLFVRGYDTRGAVVDVYHPGPVLRPEARLGANDVSNLTDVLLCRRSRHACLHLLAHESNERTHAVLTTNVKGEKFRVVVFALHRARATVDLHEHGESSALDVDVDAHVQTRARLFLQHAQRATAHIAITPRDGARDGVQLHPGVRFVSRFFLGELAQTVHHRHASSQIILAHAFISRSQQVWIPPLDLAQSRRRGLLLVFIPRPLRSPPAVVLEIFTVVLRVSRPSACAPRSLSLRLSRRRSRFHRLLVHAHDSRLSPFGRLRDHLLHGRDIGAMVALVRQDAFEQRRLAPAELQPVPSTQRFQPLLHRERGQIAPTLLYPRIGHVLGARPRCETTRGNARRRRGAAAAGTRIRDARARLTRAGDVRGSASDGRHVRALNGAKVRVRARATRRRHETVVDASVSEGRGRRRDALYCFIANSTMRRADTERRARARRSTN